MRKKTAKIHSLDDAVSLAHKRIPKGVMQKFRGSSGIGLTTRRNREALEQIEFLPRAAVFNVQPQLETTIVGQRVAMPLYLSSVGGLKAGHVGGELAVARSAGRAGTIQMVSGVTSTPIEDIVAQATGPVFQQLYYFDNKGDITAAAIERCEAAGVAALVLLGDSPTYGVPEIPYRERAFAPTGMTVWDALRFMPQMLRRPAWTWDFIRDGMNLPMAAMAVDASGKTLGFAEAVSAHFRSATNWADLPWIREHWEGPIIMKGIVSVHSARRAVEEGIDAIVVSNHGGNSLDGTVPTIEALPPIVDAVGDQIEILVDGGFKRRSDVMKAVALGARAVGMGRGYVYPLLAAGEPGIDHILAMYRQQMLDTLRWLGVGSVHELGRSFVRLPGEPIRDGGASPTS